MAYFLFHIYVGNVHNQGSIKCLGKWHFIRLGRVTGTRVSIPFWPNPPAINSKVYSYMYNHIFSNKEEVCVARINT